MPPGVVEPAENPAPASNVDRGFFRAHRTALTILLVWIGLVGASLLIETVTERQVPLCVFRNVTGAPCPTCGSTRVVLSLASADVWSAVRFNPLVTGVILCGPVWGALRLRRRQLFSGKGDRGRGGFGAGAGGIAWLTAGIVLLVANWLYLLGLGPDAVW